MTAKITPLVFGTRINGVWRRMWFSRQCMGCGRWVRVGETCHGMRV
jgi:hypothetical protein